jgi:tetratricopeptide (TPR) repeat protein
MGSEFVPPLLRARDWQDRPQFTRLCEWWQNGGFGVCALVGLGGAGKTAIVERFLQVLRGAYPEHPRVPKDRSLPPAPERLLVFSFYKEPNPDAFFDTISRWLDLPSQGSVNPVEAVANVGRCLLVLDGLEKVQDDGTRGGVFGQIGDGRLRDFLLRVSDGWFPHVSILITSRFRLFDLPANRVYYYHQSDVNMLPRAAALQLLRDRGVLGTDDELNVVVNELGLHALSVDLAGGYIERFCEGRATEWKSLDIPMDSGAIVLDPRIAAIRAQEERFGRLTARYRDALAESDPAALALLQRICLFRLGVTAEMLAAIFLGESKEAISGPDLSRLTFDEMQTRLAILSEMRLIEATTRPSSYTIHPAVRDGFLRELSPETARSGHEAARRVLEASLGATSELNPSDAPTLDLLEEIVYHALSAGHPDEAWDLYWDRMGAYSHLGHLLGAFHRGERICRNFMRYSTAADTTTPSGLSASRYGQLLNEWAVYLATLGQPRAAIDCLERALRIDGDQPAGIIYWINLAYTRLGVGRLNEALAAATQAERMVVEMGASALRANACIALAEIQVLRGSLADALRNLSESMRSFVKNGESPFGGGRSVTRANLMLGLGRIAEARESTENAISMTSSQLGDKHLWTADYGLALAEIALVEGNLETARTYVQRSHDWSLQCDAKQRLCRCLHISACIELAAFCQNGMMSSLVRASASIDEGLQIAHECGYALRYIDLLLLRAQAALYEGRGEDAERDVRVAVAEGVPAPSDSSFPDLLPASHPQCGYAWAVAEAHQLMAEALLLQAAQYQDKAESLKARARNELRAALQAWRALRDPEGDGEINPRGQRARRVFDLLEHGVSIDYPIRPVIPTERREVVPARKRNAIFISYAHEDDEPPKRWLHRLMVHLKPLVRQQDLVVWCDQQLKVGDSWRAEIQRHLSDARVAVLLVSPAFLASEFIANEELPVFLMREQSEGLKILPVLLAPSVVHRTKFGEEGFALTNFHAAGLPTHTLSEMPEAEQNRVLAQLAERIMELVSG